jgi:hypothetical protein
VLLESAESLCEVCGHNVKMRPFSMDMFSLDIYAGLSQLAAKQVQSWIELS